MTQVTDELRALEKRFYEWQERYRKYCAMLANFRVHQQEFDSFMTKVEQEHRYSSPKPTQETPPDSKTRQQ